MFPLANPLAPPTGPKRLVAPSLAALACATVFWTGQPFWLLVAAPVLEETVFRAGLQQTLLERFQRRGPVGAHGAGVLTGLAFAAWHVAARPSWLAATTLFPALAIGWLYQRRRSVGACIGLHAIFNAIWLASGFARVSP